MQDVTYYSKSGPLRRLQGLARRRPGLLRTIRRARAPGSPKLTTRTTRYDQAGKKITGVERVFDTKVFEGNVWGLQWFNSDVSPKGVFPQYFKHDRRRARRRSGRRRARRDAVARAGVQAGRAGRTLHLAGRRRLEPARPEARTVHGQAGRRFRGDVLLVPLCRSAVLPAVSLERGEEGELAGLRGEDPCELAHRPRLHGASQPRRLVALDPALLVTPPKGLEVGYVPS